ncbi:MAG: hypothetical protein AMS17_07360 [Spirochaetes bacterium DG_61]|jgi:peptidyl-prolyl cis-trans isomerase SurA|nr:MAG: hypothetical protein AMS17_07360 [Spirochaetes bacterium DG_61]
MRKLLLIAIPALLFVIPISAAIVNGIACKVGDAVITIHEFNTAYEREKTQALLLGIQVPIKKNVMETLVTELIIKKEAEEKGIVVTGDELEVLVAEVMKQNQMTREEFTEQLKKEKMSIEDLEDMIKIDLLKNRLISQMISERKNLVSDGEIRSFYDDPANKRYFTSPVSLKLSQIFIGVPENASYKELMEIKKLASEISERAQKGESFADLAELYSEQNVNIENRGSLGSFTARQLTEIMQEEQVLTVFSLSSQQVSPPLWLSEGYAIIRVDQRSEEKVLTFDEARGNIKSFLLRKKGEELFRDWLVTRRNALRVHYMIDME